MGNSCCGLPMKDPQNESEAGRHAREEAAKLREDITRPHLHLTMPPRPWLPIVEPVNGQFKWSVGTPRRLSIIKTRSDIPCSSGSSDLSIIEASSRHFSGPELAQQRLALAQLCHPRLSIGSLGEWLEFDVLQLIGFKLVAPLQRHCKCWRADAVHYRVEPGDLLCAQNFCNHRCISPPDSAFS